jgi:hypothetical protein
MRTYKSHWVAAIALAVASVVTVAPALAQSMYGEAEWQPGPGATTSEYFCNGAIDWPLNGSSLPMDKTFTVNGWIVDPNAEGWAGFDAVQVYAGKAGEGGKLLSVADVAQTRPDVAATLGNAYWVASGFQADVPTGLLAPGPVDLTVYAHSPANGWWYQQVHVNVVRPRLAQPVLQIDTPKPTDQLKTSQDYTISGFALDPGAVDSVGVDQVEVYINGERGSDRAQLVGRADVSEPNDAALNAYGRQFANAGWSVTIRPTRYHAGNTLLYVYARSTATGSEALTTLDINIVEK